MDSLAGPGYLVLSSASFLSRCLALLISEEGEGEELEKELSLVLPLPFEKDFKGLFSLLTEPYVQ